MTDHIAFLMFLQMLTDKMSKEKVKSVKTKDIEEAIDEIMKELSEEKKPEPEKKEEEPALMSLISALKYCEDNIGFLSREDWPSNICIDSNFKLLEIDLDNHFIVKVLGLYTPDPDDDTGWKIITL